jgi:hypothetical protein
MLDHFWESKRKAGGGKRFQSASQFVHLPSGQLLDGIFNFSDTAHSRNLPRPARERQEAGFEALWDLHETDMRYHSWDMAANGY